ncbi:MAG TPA: hypothetical protein ENL03_04705 [Phycisphaerae bacterium]|nr:hypothetical protein [Phycisphaerae bacterium]
MCKMALLLSGLISAGMMCSCAGPGLPPPTPPPEPVTFTPGMLKISDAYSRMNEVAPVGAKPVENYLGSNGGIIIKLSPSDNKYLPWLESIEHLVKVCESVCDTSPRYYTTDSVAAQSMLGIIARGCPSPSGRVMALKILVSLSLPHDGWRLGKQYNIVQNRWEIPGAEMAVDYVLAQVQTKEDVDVRNALRVIRMEGLSTKMIIVQGSYQRDAKSSILDAVMKWETRYSKLSKSVTNRDMLNDIEGILAELKLLKSNVDVYVKQITFRNQVEKLVYAFTKECMGNDRNTLQPLLSKNMRKKLAKLPAEISLVAMMSDEPKAQYVYVSSIGKISQVGKQLQVKIGIEARLYSGVTVLKRIELPITKTPAGLRVGENDSDSTGSKQ